MALFTTQRRVAFSDTDRAGVVHFARTLIYGEDAEHEWLEGVGFDLGGELAWPRVNVNCNYRHPMRFRDRVTISILSVELGASSLTYGFRIRGDEKTYAEGSVTVVRIFQGGGKAPFSEEERALLTATS